MSGAEEGTHPTEPYPRGLGLEHPVAVPPPSAAGPLPRDAASGATAPPRPPLPSAPVAVPPPRRRARWPWVLGIVVILLAVLVVGGEFVARAVVAQQIRSQAIAALKLPADQQMDVAVGGIVLPQLVAGRLDDVRISSKSVAIGPITSAVQVDATGVPIRGGALGSARGTFRITADQLEKAITAAAGSTPIESVTLDGEDVTATGSVKLFGATVPLALALTPGAAGGELTFTPTSATIGAITVDPDTVASSPFGAALKPLFTTQKLCIADRLPAGVHLSGLHVDAGALVATFSADSAITTDPTLLENGTCPAS
ncbi:LmeA family phospholipid-binding protein [Microbacterium sp. 2MCAF23]|uniref:LmeA family phospholipid-binding protein n=1 Tax=Microbacterium sp. 2MCAF23 TaxID=3232985 RepID=UPI003F986038